MTLVTVDESAGLDTLETATKRYRRTEKAHREARAEAIALCLKLLREGVPPTKVANASPFTAAWVRKLARDNGIGGPKGQ
jgi:hypothetical protein